MIPAALLWILAVGTVRALSLEGPIDRNYLIAAAIAAMVVFIALGFVPEREQGANDPPQPATGLGAADVDDAFAGGYPVPPMPEQEQIRG